MANVDIQAERNYIEGYFRGVRYRITTGTKDEEMDKFGKWLLESFVIIDQQAEDNKDLHKEYQDLAAINLEQKKRIEELEVKKYEQDMP